MQIPGASDCLCIILNVVHQHHRICQEGPRYVHWEGCRAGGRRFMVPAASQSQATMAPRDVRVRERHGEALQEMKERTGRFYNNLSEGLNLQSFIDLFMLWYHHLREASGT